MRQFNPIHKTDTERCCTKKRKRNIGVWCEGIYMPKLIPSSKSSHTLRVFFPHFPSLACRCDRKMMRNIIVLVTRETTEKNSQTLFARFCCDCENARMYIETRRKVHGNYIWSCWVISTHRWTECFTYTCICISNITPWLYTKNVVVWNVVAINV